MKPLLSIVVPVYNRASLVVRTLDSMAASEYRPLEILLVDDGSFDDSLAVCRQWAEAHREEGLSIEVLNEPHRGGNAARNVGLKHCRGDYVFFFDSDDLFCGDALDDVAAAVSSEDADMLFLPVVQEKDGRAQVRAYQPKASLSLHVLNSMFSTESMVFRRAWLMELGGWNEQVTVWQDWELGARALMHHPRIQWLCERTYHRVLLHPQSVTGHNFSQTLDGTLATMRMVAEEVKQASSLSETVRHKSLLAMYYRAMLMAAKLCKEGHKAGDEAYRELAKQILPMVSCSHRGMARFLGAYTAWGGRGAWRMAAALVGAV